jgi:hypothetical protein
VLKLIHREPPYLWVFFGPFTFYRDHQITTFIVHLRGSRNLNFARARGRLPVVALIPKEA